MTATIELQRWPCGWWCVSCRATTTNESITAPVSIGVLGAIHTLLNTTDFYQWDGLSIHIWWKIIKAVDLWINNAKVTELQIALPVEYAEAMIDDIFRVIEEQLKLFPGVKSLIIGISRERENLLKQYELASEIIAQILARLYTKKTAIEKVMLRTWTNDMVPDKMSESVMETRVFFEWIGVHKNTWHSEEKGEYFQAGRKLGGIIVPFIDRWTTTMWFETKQEDTLFQAEWLIKFAHLELRIENSIRAQTGWWKDTTPKGIAAETVVAGTHRHVLFSGDKVNVYHVPEYTNVWGVWVSLSAYNWILSRASDTSYNWAIVDHFLWEGKIQRGTAPETTINLKRGDLYKTENWKKLDPLDRAEILLVLEGLKPGIIFPEIIGGDVIALAQENNLRVEYLHIDGFGDFTVIGEQKAIDEYREKVKTIKKSRIQLHKLNGHMLGYPRCCVDEYIHNRKNRIFRLLASPRQYISNLEQELISWWDKAEKDMFPENILLCPPAFKPCSLSCKESQEKLSAWTGVLRAWDYEAYVALRCFNLDVGLRSRIIGNNDRPTWKQQELIAKSRLRKAISRKSTTTD